MRIVALSLFLCSSFQITSFSRFTSFFKPYVSPKTRQETAISNLAAIQRDVITWATTISFLHNVQKDVTFPNLSTQNVPELQDLSSFSGDLNTLTQKLDDSKDKIEALEAAEDNKNKVYDKLGMAAQLGVAAVLGSTGTPSRKYDNEIIRSRGLTITAGALIIDPVLSYLQHKFLPKPTNKLVQTCMSLTRRGMAMLAAGCAYELTHYKKRTRFITGLELPLLTQLLPALSFVPVGIAGWCIGRKISDFFTAREREEKELLARKIRDEYAAFCDKYKPTIDALNKKVAELSDDVKTVEHDVTTLSKASHHAISELTTNLNEMHETLQALTATHTHEKQEQLSKIQELEEAINNIRQNDIDSLSSVRTQLNELKDMVSTTQDRTDAIANKLQKEALPKMAEIMRGFATFAQNDRARFAAILRALGTDKKMHSILENELNLSEAAAH